MNEMTITNARYVNSPLLNEVTAINATIDGQEMSVPLCEGNRHYDEIMRQVDAGTLTVQEADQGE